jgi:NADP-dependent 3-hydroxy acid dehydrogenase YdfG
MKALLKKNAVVTGATSGIGKAIAERLAIEGANVILIGRREERLRELAETWAPREFTNILPAPLDVRDRYAVVKFFDELPDDYKPIDVLVNNAGLASGFASIDQGEFDDWDKMIDTNVKGLLYVTRQVVPLMAGAEAPRILNLGSTAGREVYLNGNVYCATKFAVKALNRAMRMEFLEKNITATTIDPGFVETEFSGVRFKGDEAAAKKVYEGFEPLTAEDVADAALYCLTAPPRVNVNEMILTPRAQATATMVRRET